MLGAETAGGFEFVFVDVVSGSGVVVVAVENSSTTVKSLIGMESVDGRSNRIVTPLSSSSPSPSSNAVLFRVWW